MPRLDPSTPGEGPVLSAAVTASVRDRVIAMAVARGVARSVIIRELLELGITALDAGAVELEAAG